jgi:hypothetical protein
VCSSESFTNPPGSIGPRNVGAVKADWFTPETHPVLRRLVFTVWLLERIEAELSPPCPARVERAYATEPSGECCVCEAQEGVVEPKG